MSDLPRVTDIIKAAGVMPRYKEGNYLEKGAAVDRGCQLIFQGYHVADFEETEGFEQIKGYLISLERWLDSTGFKATAIQPEYESKKGYVCHPDVLDEITWLIDTKTGGKYKWHRMQTISYKVAANEQDNVRVQRRGSLYLQRDGSIAKLDEHTDDSTDWNAFVSALRIYEDEKKLERYRQNIKNWLEVA